MKILDNLYTDAALITTLHQEPLWREFKEEQWQSTQTLIRTFFLIVTIHQIYLHLAKKYQKTMQLTTSKDIMKLSYVATNFTVNLSLGLLGLYTILTSPNPMALINPTYEPSLLERVTGYNQYANFASYQLAYNIWALPVGIFYVDEAPLMILHHISVLTSTTLSCYSNLTYLYSSVYIFGLAELSSVPLAIMNYLKENKEWAQRNFQKGSLIFKVMFAVSFLILRVIVATPLIMDLTRSSFLVNWTLWKVWLMNTGEGSDVEYFVDIGKATICGFNFVLMCCLGILQYYWAYLIVNAMAKMAGGPKKKKME